MSAGKVHTLNMAAFRHGSDSERMAFAQDLVQCFATQGFAKLINHAVPAVALKKAFEWDDKFFKLPTHIKAEYAHPPCANPNRGWSALGQEKSSAISDFEKGEKSTMTIWDAKEAFDQGPSDDPLYENIWPSEEHLPGFRSFMETFYELCNEAHMDVLRALELVLDREGFPFKIIDLCLPNMSELRLNYYPEIEIKELRSGHINRISEHTDFGTVTLLFQDSIGGLEIEDQSRQGHYFPVECDSVSTMLVNIGDSLQRLTNDALTSVSHRVVIPVSKKEESQGTIAERRTVAYFAKVHRQNSLRPLPPFVSDSMPAKYPDVSAFEWNQAKLERIYGVC